MVLECDSGERKDKGRAMRTTCLWLAQPCATTALALATLAILCLVGTTSGQSFE
jgi:hypothetical protein